MTPLDEARSFVVGLGSKLGSVEVPVAEADGLVLVEDVVASELVPGDDNAVRSPPATAARSRWAGAKPCAS